MKASVYKLGVCIYCTVLHIKISGRQSDGELGYIWDPDWKYEGGTIRMYRKQVLCQVCLHVKA